MSAKKQGSGLRTFATFLGGVAAGAALGMLLAPEKGSETRRKINDKARDLENDVEGQLGDALAEFGAKSRVTLNDFRKQATELFDRANLRFQEILSQYAVADDILDFEPEEEDLPRPEQTQSETAGKASQTSAKPNGNASHSSGPSTSSSSGKTSSQDESNETGSSS